MGDAGEPVASATDLKPSRYAPLFPKAMPDGRSLQLILWLAQEEQIGLVYSREPLSVDTSNADALKAGAIALTQRPFSGRDAKSVLDVVPRNKWVVQVGPYQAALIWADPVAEGVRPFRLYWADGKREWSIIGNPVTPEELVGLARSLYC